MAGDETKELVKAIKEIPSHVKKPIHERKVGHWLQGVDAVIQLLPSDANIQDADKKNAQTMLANIMLGLIEELAESPALKAWAAESELKSWTDIRDAVKAEFVKSDEGRFMAAWRTLRAMKRRRNVRVQDHIMEWRSAYTNAYPEAGLPGDVKAGGPQETARFMDARMCLIETLNHKALEEAVLMGITDGRCDTWAEFSSFITSKAEALGVGRFEGELGPKDSSGKHEQNHQQLSSPGGKKNKARGKKNSRAPSTPTREKYSRAAKDGACFKCGKTGHLKRDCPETGSSASPGNGGTAGGH